MTVSFTPLPPAEAVDFFRKKGLVESYAWQDVWQEEHAAAFTVAKSTGYDILSDIFGAVDSALAEGTTFETFRRDLEPTLIKKGWWGRKESVDPLTGEVRKAQLGSRRRLRIIYDTNLRMARAAGAWERIERNKKRRPYLMYDAVNDGRTRPQHRAWDNTVLPVDDSWWETHYPPNGWKCRCTVIQLSERDLQRRRLNVSRQPVIKNRRYDNPRTGKPSLVPEGIDPGFAYNVGRARLRSITPAPAAEPFSDGSPLLIRGQPPRVSAFPPGDLPVRKVSADRLLPEGLAPEEYYRRFVQEFGLDEKGGFFTDVTGRVMPINDLLFRDAEGQWKILKKGRERYLSLLAETLLDPAEIWEEFIQHRVTGQFFLDRRYLVRFQVMDAGKPRDGIVAFEQRDNTWYGSTAFIADWLGAVKRRRKGVLIYKKGREK
tara:strand:- start:3425 stop:4717 length:1293 start_codon:yes stop_codon:yes gene_type:complete